MPGPACSEYRWESPEREQFVRGLFDDAASDYDRLSSLLSFGTDRWYRRQVLRRMGLTGTTRLLDVATGTGLIVRAALQEGCRPGNIVGLDPSPGMLVANGDRNAVALVRGRGEDLPLRSNHFDLVTMGYALRHVADLGRLFTEFHRVLRPGGRVLILEITRPRSRVLQRLIALYFGRIVPLLLGRDRRERAKRLMRYYCTTIELCVPPTSIVTALKSAGFTGVVAEATGPVLTDFTGTKS